uniref:MPN domain-containing protein n=1 Tax=Strongyloides venezuelensis TaxID=75913 RepID=A0A0K0G1D6_STRVS
MVLTISTIAYCKAVLHCVKYPHCPIKGFLIADGFGKNSIVVDAIPISHDIPTFAGIFESSLLFIERYCNDNGYVIGGVYFANQMLNDKKLDPCVVKLAEKLQSKYPKIYIMQLDNTKFSLESSSKCVLAHVYDTELKEWKETEQPVEDVSSTLRIASKAIDLKMERQVSDYENFLDNPKIHDILNLKLNLGLEKYLSM